MAFLFRILYYIELNYIQLFLYIYIFEKSINQYEHLDKNEAWTVTIKKIYLMKKIYQRRYIWMEVLV